MITGDEAVVWIKTVIVLLLCVACVLIIGLAFVFSRVFP